MIINNSEAELVGEEQSPDVAPFDERVQRALLDPEELTELHGFGDTTEQVITAYQQRLELWQTAIADLGQIASEPHSTTAPMMMGNATTVEDYLAIAEIQVDVILDTIDSQSSIRELVRWLSNHDTQAIIVASVYSKLARRKAAIINTETSRYCEKIERIFPSAGDRVEVPTSLSLPVSNFPAANRWRKNKDISSQAVASDVYVGFIKASRAEAVSSMTETLNHTDDDVADEVETSDIKRHLRDAINYVIGMDNQEDEEFYYERVSKAIGPEAVVGEDDVLEKWALATDPYEKAQYLAEYKKSIKDTKKHADLVRSTGALSRQYWLEELPDRIVAELETEYSDSWRHQVKMTFEEVVAAQIDEFAKKLNTYEHVDTSKRQSTAKVRKKVAHRVVEIAERMEAVPEPVDIDLPWLDESVQVQILTIEGKKIGLARGVASPNVELTNDIENTSHKNVLQEKQKNALHYAVNGTWNSLPSLANTAKNKYPYKIKKFSKKHGEALRFYFTMVPVKEIDQLSVHGVDQVVVFLGGCKKNDQTHFLKEFTGLNVRQLSQYGAGK